MKRNVKLFSYIAGFIFLGVLLSIFSPITTSALQNEPSRPTLVSQTQDAPTDVPPTQVAPTQPPSRATEIPPTSVPPTQFPPTEPQPTLPIPETFCQMSVENGPDPFTYNFNVTNAENIDTYLWDFGDGGNNTNPNTTHTYADTGTYNITLTCNPLPGFGAALVLNGSITISNAPVANFTLSPGDTFVGLPPFSISTVNQSAGGGLIYDWKISTNSDPLVAAGIFYTANTENITYTFTDTDFTNAGFGPAGPAIFHFHLTVSDASISGLSSTATRSVAFGPPPPEADFSVDPGTGAAPLTVTVLGEDLGAGPITNWSWDFDNDNIEDANGVGPHNWIYNTAGVFPITLTFTGPGGGGMAVREIGVYDPIEPVQALFDVASMQSVPGGIEVCFNNNSTGPVATSQWDFNDDGVWDLTSNEDVVCNIYATETVVVVRLRVSDLNGTATSTASNTISVVASPIASFNVVPGTTITWGTNINLQDTSTGLITTWEWDFNGDGVTDSTIPSPNGIALTELGANPIRLTITGPGGTSFAEAIIMVERLEITCDFTGSLNVLPGAGGQTYTSVIGDDGGRPITYNWTVTGNGAGLPLSFNTPNINVDWASIGYGAFQVTLNASTADGSDCTESKTVNHSWSGLDCQMTNNLPVTVYATGNTYTFNATVQNLDGRPLVGGGYEWQFDGAVQAATGNTFTYTVPTGTAGLPATYTVRYAVIADNGAGYTPATSTCFDEVTFTVQPWPVLTCSNITGPANPEPFTNANYRANIGGLAGRPVSYAWTVGDGNITTPNPRPDNNNATVRWNATAGDFPPAPVDDNISVTVTASNPDGTTDSCSMANNVAVTYQQLTCNAPVGDLFPVVGETVPYNISLSNVYGRPMAAVNPLNWEFEEWDAVNSVWVPLPGGTVDPFSYNYLTPDTQYRLRYSAAVDALNGYPADSCQSPWVDIQVYGAGVGFECESALIGDLTPATPGNYSYNIDMDNGNLINLQYTWILTDSQGTEHTLVTVTDTADGTITSPNFTLAELAPLLVDHYTLRVEVQAVDQNITTYTCSRNANLIVGAINVDYTYTVGSWTNTALPIGQQICLTNVSNAVPTDITTLDYTWTVSGDPSFNNWASNTVNAQDAPGCITFNQPGTYNITLDGVNDSGLMSDQHSVDFTVYGLQSIVIDRTGSNFAPSTQNFTANGTNITGGYNWTFRRLSDNNVVGTSNQQNPSRAFATPGTYSATVVGTGPLGNTSAYLEFTLIATGGLTAAFTPSQYGGIATLDVCFTDRSISGTQIVLWEWDFENDGTFDLVYDNNGIPGSICHTYPDPATVYTATLRVTNSQFTDTATNTIRTYNLLEMNANFAITPYGGGYFCFTAQNDPGVTVTGWGFGDGNTGPGQDQICHTYGASGQYVVQMNVTNGTLTGTVVRPVVVTLTNNPPPVIDVTGTCAPDVTATFTVTNNGGDMTMADQVKILDASGGVILISPLQLAGGASVDYSVTGYEGNITLATTDTFVTTNTNCAEPPKLSGSATCGIDGSATFTVNNISAETAASQPYEVRDGSNNLIASGTLNVPIGGTDTVTVTGVWGPLTLTSVGIQGPTTDISIASDCDTPPLLAVNNTCQIDGSAVFTINNTSLDMAASQTYEVRQPSNVLIDSGTINVPAGGSTDVTINGVYGPLNFTSSGPQGVTTNISNTSNCDTPPMLTGTTTCTADGTATFYIDNTSSDTAASQPYEVRDLSNALVDSGTLNVPPLGRTNVVVVGDYFALTLTSVGPQGATTDITLINNCDEPPLLTAAGTCATDGSAIFTVSNTSSESAANQPYEVHDANGILVDSGTISVPMNGGSTDVTVSGVWGPLTFTSVGPQGITTDVSANTDCDEPPLLTGTATCTNGTATFTVINTSQDTPADQSYNITSGGVTVDSGIISVPVNSSVALTVTGASGDVVFSSNGTQGITTQVNMTTSCDASAAGIITTSGGLDLGGVCAADGTATFTATNNSNSDVYQPFSIISGGSVLQLGTLNLGAGQSQVVTVNNLSSVVSMTTSGNAGTATTAANCGDAIAMNNGTATSMMTSGSDTSSSNNAFTSILPRLDLTPGQPDTALVPRPDWEPITIGGAVCVDWLIYHTNMTGDWEVFRLGDGGDARIASFDANLSQGVGVDVVDMAPTRSPDNEWIAFTTNRENTPENENWELYIASVDNTVMRRVTYNTFAKDIDPVWSPDGRSLIFETDRDGNWELYRFDLATGVETRLTDDGANDINAFWSPDSQQFVFQSDRDGDWQIYMYDLATEEITRLSDGTTEDHDPNISFDGKRIAFRSYTSINSTSAIYVMDIDGSNKMMISDPAGSSANHTWSPDDSVIAYQSNLDGDLDIYAYEIDSEATRLVTDNTIPDYAPTWLCNAPLIVFTSDITEDPNIFNTPALPINAPAILVDEEASQMTFSEEMDVYPENSPAEENASREGNVPPRIGVETVELE